MDGIILCARNWFFWGKRAIARSAWIGQNITYQSMEAIRKWRLVFSLLLAIVVHILVVAILPHPRATPSARITTAAIEVRLASVMRQNGFLQAALANRAPNPVSQARRLIPKPRPDAVPKSLEPVPDRQRQPVLGTIYPPPKSAEFLVDAAKNFVREEARRKPSIKEEAIDIEDRPALPVLAKALEKPKPRETRFADGLVKVVATSGSVYCLKPLPGIVAHASLVDPTVVPTNCP